MVFQNGFSNVRYMQYSAAFVASLAFSSLSLAVTWTSSALAKLENSSTVDMKEQKSLINASLMLGTLPGFLLSGLIAEKIGRKRTFLLATLPACFPWLLLIFAKSAILLCIGRFCIGFFASICVACCSIYVGEISDEDIRGKASTLISTMAACVRSVVLAIGPLLSYFWLTVGCCALPLTTFLLFIIMPESPYYLVKVGKLKEAHSALKVLSANNITEKDLLAKFDKIYGFMDESMKKKKSSIFDLLKRQYRFSFMIMLGLEMLRTLTGGMVIISNLHTIIDKSGGSLSANTASAIAGVLQVPAVILVGVLVDKMGRKPLLICSCAVASVGLLSASFFFYVKDIAKWDTEQISWLPATAIIGYLFARGLGLIAIPIILLGELFASNIKGVAVSFATLSGATMNFFLLLYFQPVNEAFGWHVSFLAFGITSFLGIFFSYFIVPETKNKSLTDIQIKLNRRFNKPPKIEEFQITHL